MRQKSLHREVLAQAAELSGGSARLAERLGVETAEVHRWIVGKPPAPSKVVFAALALIDCESRTKPAAQPSRVQAEALGLGPMSNR